MLGAFILIVCACLIGDVAWLLWADRKLKRTRHPKVWRPLAALWTSLLLGYLLFFILFPREGRHAHAWMPVWALAAVYLWHLLILPPIVLMLAGAGIARSIRSAVRWWNRGKEPPKPLDLHDLAAALSASPATAPTRRQILTAAVCALPPLATAGTIAISIAQLGRLRIRRFELSFPTLPRELDGLAIAQVSDIHVGRFTRPHMLPAIADATNQLKADLILLTGDLIDLTLSDLPVALDFVRKLDPRHGLFIIEGNHDLIESPQAFDIGVRSAGYPLLLDQATTITVRSTPLQLLGLSWRRGDAGIIGAMSNLLPQRNPDLFQILLAHHPHAFDPAASVGIPLTLSGHTHGGQLMLNEQLGFGPAMFRYWSGRYTRGASELIVSNGIGNWYPLRVNAPAELVHITLRSTS